LLIGKRESSNSKELHIIHMIRLSIQHGSLQSQIQKYIDAFNPDKVVLDAGPDFSTPQGLVAGNRYGQVFGCEYHRKVAGAYTHLDTKPDEGVLKADRSGTLNDTMKMHNGGHIHYPAKCEEVEVAKEHLKVTKKLVRKGEMGDIVTYPKPDKADHYAHALNYLVMADTIASDHSILPKIVGVLPGVTAVKIGSQIKDTA
jgi:hypothetical protein